MWVAWGHRLANVLDLSVRELRDTILCQAHGVGVLAQLQRNNRCWCARSSWYGWEVSYHYCHGPKSREAIQKAESHEECAEWR